MTARVDGRTVSSRFRPLALAPRSPTGSDTRTPVCIVIAPCQQDQSEPTPSQEPVPMPQTCHLDRNIQVPPSWTPELTAGIDRLTPPELTAKSHRCSALPQVLTPQTPAIFVCASPLDFYASHIGQFVNWCVYSTLVKSFRKEAAAILGGKWNRWKWGQHRSDLVGPTSAQFERIRLAARGDGVNLGGREALGPLRSQVCTLVSKALRRVRSRGVPKEA